MTTARFSLRKYLAADIRRYRALTSGQADAPVSAGGVLATLLSPRFMPVFLCRLAHWLYLHRLGPLAKLVSLVNYVFFGIEIAVRCPIGQGLFFPHTVGTVIGPEEIGENATIYHNVTLGAREIDIAYSAGRRPRE